MARTAKKCIRCRATCTDDNLSLTIRLTAGSTVLTYKPIYVCSEECLGAWAMDTIWHDDGDPRVEAAVARNKSITDTLAAKEE